MQILQQGKFWVLILSIYSAEARLWDLILEIQIVYFQVSFVTFYSASLSFSSYSIVVEFILLISSVNF